MAIIAVYETVGDALVDIAELTTFNQLVRRSGVIVDLDGEGPYTVFAPENEAFDRLPDNALGRFVKQPALLTELVRHHIVFGMYEADRLTDGLELPALYGAPLSVLATVPGPHVGGARVLTTDIGAYNGIIHTVESVMMP